MGSCEHCVGAGAWCVCVCVCVCTRVCTRVSIFAHASCQWRGKVWPTDGTLLALRGCRCMCVCLCARMCLFVYMCFFLKVGQGVAAGGFLSALRGCRCV